MTESKLREALQFYADREHYHLDEWDSVSGEPPNWLHPPESSEDQPWMVEDGSIAREALSQPTSDEGTPTETPQVDALLAELGTSDDAERWCNSLQHLARQLERTLHAKERELADQDTVPRSRYNACNQDWLNALAELKEVREIAKAEIKRLTAEFATLQSVSAAPPSGYVQVPVEPTQDWLDSVANRLGIGDAEMRELHSALLAATPTPGEGA